MFRLFAAALLGLICSTAAYAQIKVEASYPAYTTFTIDCEVPEGHDFRSVHWTFSPAKISAKEGPNGELYATGVPGLKYTVVCDVVSGKLNTDGTATIDRKDHKRYESTFVIEKSNDDSNVEPGPEPSPGPQPGPQPNPAPVVENATVLLIEETALRTVEHVKVINDVNFWASIISRGMTWRLYDKDSADLAANLKEAAERVGLPAVVIHSNGRVLSATPLPKTTAEVNAEIKRVTGK